MKELEIKKNRTAVQEQLDNILTVARLINSTNDPKAVTEIRARLEAVKGWAKIHKQTKELRLTLLLMEIRALKKLYELGGEDECTKSEWEAAEGFSHLSDSEIAEMAKKYGSATTGAGLWRQSKIANNRESRYRDEVSSWSETFLSDDRIIEIPIEEVVSERKKYVGDSLAAMQDAFSEVVEDNEAFTIDDLASRFVENARIDGLSKDSAVYVGLKEAARRVVCKAPPETWNGTKIPQTITSIIADVQTGEKTFIRIPIALATVGDVRQMVGLREEQLQADENALSRLREFLQQLESQSDVTEKSKVSKVIAKSLMDTGKAV